MDNMENKNEFIKRLFLYYKPILSKKKQIQLLSGWLKSCLIDEEYEMANTIKFLICDVNNDIEVDDGNLSVVPIGDISNLHYNDNFINGKITKLDKKPIKKRWKLVNIWGRPYDFILLNLQFSIKKRTFKLIIINYGLEYC